jgi:hypothetical protein
MKSDLTAEFIFIKAVKKKGERVKNFDANGLSLISPLGLCNSAEPHFGEYWVTFGLDKARLSIRVKPDSSELTDRLDKVLSVEVLVCKPLTTCLLKELDLLEGLFVILVS